MVDEAYVGFYDGATIGYDDFDAHKLFSFNENYPQLYSTANDFMAINSLPIDYIGNVAMDVRGEDASEMTISLTEDEGFDDILLKDEFTGLVTDLKLVSYTFTYNAEINDRFTLLFGVTDINEDPITNDVRIFAYNKNIHVVLDAQSNANITVYNLMGQKITSQVANSSVTLVPVTKSGYYVVKVSDGKYVSSQKVYIK
jgi:intracellular sulfur oxidation DsrE/DsrF family protein